MGATHQALLIVPTGGATDTYWSEVKMLLHAEGANGGTTFTNSATGGVDPTGSGGVVTSTEQAKLGSSSIKMGGGGDYLSRTDSPTIFSVTTGDFTAEAFIYPNVNNSTRMIMAKRTSGTSDGGWQLYMNASGQLAVTAWSGASAVVSFAGATTVTTGAWHHVAVTKSGTTWRILLNGAEDGSATQSAAPTENTSALLIGRNAADSAHDFNGYMDEVRITMGTARYTGAYDVPTAAFPEG